jgi:hypothetical protein
MKKNKLTAVFFLCMSVLSFPVMAQQAVTTAAKATEKTSPDAQVQQKAAAFTASLTLNDPAKEARVTSVIATHLIAVRDWHNSHDFATVPAGIDPRTGDKLSDLERQIIMDSSIPKTVHENLMSGLRKELSEEQVEAILDQYTIGKVAFTMAGYKSIVPNMTEKEEATILAYMKQAREMAVDFKSMKQISGIFEIFKTKSEQYLNSNGRNWKEMYKAYTTAAKAKKAAAAAATTTKTN